MRALCIALCAVAVIAAGAQERAPFTGTVTRVLDGDTIEVRADGIVRIRLEGIDCPEAGQPFSQVARNFTRQLVFDRVVKIKPVTTDRYGRTVAKVLIDGRDVSVELAKAGLAWHFTEYSSDPVLAAAERDARAAHRGVWSQPNPTPPWVARRPATATPRTTVPQTPQIAGGVLHGNTSSRVFHLPTCPNYSCRNCTAIFRDAEEAVAAGYKPAGDCAGRGR